MDYAEIIAKANGASIVYYECFGEYQGEWVLMTEKDSQFFIYKDWYGSCTGCDALEEFVWRRPNSLSELTSEEIAEFAANYKPFAVIPHDALIEAIECDELKSIMPGNLEWSLSEGYREMSEEDAWSHITQEIARCVKED